MKNLTEMKGGENEKAVKRITLMNNENSNELKEEILDWKYFLITFLASRIEVENLQVLSMQSATL